MDQEVKQAEKPKAKRETWYVILGVPLIMAFDLKMEEFGLPFFIHPFLGINIMLIINIFYYRKSIKAPWIEFIITLPMGILFVFLSFPKFQNMPIGAMLLFIFGGSFALFAFLFMQQERKKRKQCNVMTIATVLDNVKKYTTSRRRGKRTIKTVGAGRAYSYSPVISYYAGGEEIEATYGNGFPQPIPQGTKIEILYDSENPEEFCFADEEQDKPFHIMSLIFIVAGLISTVGSIYWIIRVSI